jgi:hypothetical protein
MRRRDVEAKLFDEPRQAGRLAFGQVKDEARQGRGVDDRVLERALQAAADEPGVEGVVAVLHQHRALGEPKEGPSRVLELRGADEHRAVDVVALARVGIDGRAAVDEGVEERERPVETEPLGSDLQHQERRVAGRLDVQGDELRLLEWGGRRDLGRVDGNLLVGDELGRSSWLQVERSRAHLASARARRAQAISSPLSARRTSTAAA